jgi:hypothetical protein
MPHVKGTYGRMTGLACWVVYLSIMQCSDPLLRHLSGICNQSNVLCAQAKPRICYIFLINSLNKKKLCFLWSGSGCFLCVDTHHNL